eukprot:GFUD01006918.1.p1 GENE.GFUD01006918.1~~GFUD01006918.1.p1  ORF type:complete len:906 (+),score=327.78 GFUD01006918.1:1356-4073(+)
MEKRKKMEEIERKQVEEAAMKKRKDEEERKQIEEEKQMIAVMKQQLMEKAKMLEEKEKQLKHEEEYRKNEELKKKNDEQCKKKEEEKKLKRALEEKDKISREALRLEQERKMREEQIQVEEIKKQKRVDEDNKKREVKERKLEVLAKEKKLREEAEMKKNELRKHILKVNETTEDKTSQEDSNHTRLQPVEVLNDSDRKGPQNNIPEIPLLEVINQPFKLKSPGRKPVNHRKQTEAEREEQKQEMMQAKIDKRRSKVEKTIQNTEMVRKQARAQMEKFENDKMEKNLKKSIKSAEINLEMTALSRLDSSKSAYLEASEDTEIQKSTNNDPKRMVSNPVLEEVLGDSVLEPSNQHKKKIRIGRRPVKKAAAKEQEIISEKVERLASIEPTKNASPNNEIEEIELPTDIIKKPETIDLDRSTNAKESQVEVISPPVKSPANVTCSESLLYPTASTRRSSRGQKSVPETVPSKTSRASKRKPRMSVHEEVPPKKDMSVAKEVIPEKPKRGRKKNSVATSEKAIKPVAGEDADVSPRRRGSFGEVSPPKKVKVDVVKGRARKKIAPPEVQEDSPLYEKLDKRKKEIEDTDSTDIVPGTNRLSKKGPVSQLTVSLKINLAKQQNEVDDSVMSTIWNEKSEVTKRDDGIDDMIKSTNSKGRKTMTVKKTVEEKVAISNGEPSEEPMLLSRPRRNCKKRFENLKEPSSSVSNSPTTVKATKSKIQPTPDPNDNKPVEAKKKPAGRKTGKTVKTPPSQTPVAEESNASKVIVHSPVTSQPSNTVPSQLTPKPAKKPKKGKLSAVRDQIPKSSVPTNPSASVEESEDSKPVRSKPKKADPLNVNTNTRRRTKPQVPGVMSTMTDEVYQTPSTRVPDEMYQTPQQMGSFSAVLDEEYQTPAETVKKPSTRQRRAK